MALIPVFASLLYYGHKRFSVDRFYCRRCLGRPGRISRAAFQPGIRARYDNRSNRRQAFDDDGLHHPDNAERSRAPPVICPSRFGSTAAVIGRDVLIITVAGAINVMTGFRGFKPSWLGKASTFVQIIAVGLILLSPVIDYSFYLPTVYTTVACFAVFSGIHYIFHVARLMKEDDGGT